jgi:MOSC domain-containing protein YiiM
MEGELVGLQVGKVQRLCMPPNVRVDYRHPFWTSGILKEAAAGPVQVTTGGVEGDGQADLEHHGGPDNVVLAYDAAHYPVWREKLGIADLSYGAFGENFTVTGFSDATVCIGDVWEIGGEGGLLMQVTQPRQPCYKLARRLLQPHIVKMVHETGWGGWYLRVLRPGPAAVGMAVRQMARTHPEWNIVTALEAMYGRRRDRGPAAALAGVEELSVRWKRELLDD